MSKLRFEISTNKIFIFLTAILTFAVGSFVVSLSMQKESSIPRVEEFATQTFTIEVPPHLDKNSSDKEIYSGLVDYGIQPIPYSEFQKRKIPLPNVCGFLTVSLKNNGKIMLNFEEQKDLEVLSQRLKTIFQQREEYGVYEENSLRVIKKVMIKAPRSTKYGDVLKIVSAVQESGAEPLVLMFDEYPAVELTK